jgi:hypothetical protein
MVTDIVNAAVQLPLGGAGMELLPRGGTRGVRAGPLLTPIKVVREGRLES